jgi:hypothetical protein
MTVLMPNDKRCQKAAVIQSVSHFSLNASETYQV